MRDEEVDRLINDIRTNYVAPEVKYKYEIKDDSMGAIAIVILMFAVFIYGMLSI
jgi:hypothetical protein